jgi:hypothetical protein
MWSSPRAKTWTALHAANNSGRSRHVMTATPFTVVALIAAHNEADIIEQVVEDLIRQGISVYLMDDSSDDGTVALIQPYLNRGVIAIEHLAETIGVTASDGFQWHRILERKAALAQTLDADWFIHHDADEFRESPWFDEPLRDAIRRVDLLGYNAIDSSRFDFWPTNDDYRPGDDVRTAMPFYSEPAEYNRLQVRCWKKTPQPVDLASTGGHEVTFPGRSVFPIRFILRHYAIRGQQHGQRKIANRRARFLPAERERGWHVQYDEVDEHSCLLRDPSSLARFDPLAVRISLLLHHRHMEAHEREQSSLNGQLTHLREALAERTLAVEHLTAVVEDTQRRLDELHQSFSWRCTSPARAMYRVLRGVVKE